jgi:RNA polymerase sigma-70 factor (ECF subfamily)
MQKSPSFENFFTMETFVSAATLYNVLQYKPMRASDPMEAKNSLDAKFVDALRRHRLSMYRVALSMLKSPVDAEDAVADATLSAYQAIRRIRDWEAIKPYLMRVTVNACYGILRKKKREPIQEAKAILAARATRDETPLWMLTQQLPPNMRIVVQMRYGEDMQLHEIATALRIPKGTVSSRLNRAQKELKRQMEKEGWK